MKKNNRNIRVCAVNNGNRDGFNIYLDFSGQREYLIYHRHNGFGCFHVGRTGSSGLYEVTKHLVSVINDYMLEREA